MKTSQLMLGDLVMVNGETRKIDSISMEVAHLYGDCDLVWIMEDAIEPIPLTAEMLEKIGFENRLKSGFMQKIHEGELRIRANPFFINIYSASARESKVNLKPHQVYVHELQHALRLCGLNEIADNFKI